MNKEERRYLTLEDKINGLVEYSYQGIMDDFDMKHTEEEIEEMDENDTYFDKVREEKLEVEGYEDVTFREWSEMSNEDIVNVYNICRGTNLTVEEIDEMKVYWNGNFRAVCE